MAAAAVDKEGLRDTSGEWRAGAMNRRRIRRRRGHDVGRIAIEVVGLVAWRVGENRRLDGSARAAFVVWKGARRARHEMSGSMSLTQHN